MSEIPNPMAGGPAAPGAVNWGDLMSQAGGFEPLPNGDYNVQIQEASDAETAKGKTMFKITFIVTDGPHANRKLWTNLTISPESAPALGIFFSQMAALGLTKEFFEAGPSPAAVAQSLLGKTATVTVTTREWNGTLRNEVRGIKKAKGGIGVPAPGMSPSPQPTIPTPTSAPTLPF